MNNGDRQDEWTEVEEATELLHEERFIEAILELRRVIQQHPRNAYAYHYLGVALYETGQHAAARDAYRAALVISPRYLGARVHLCTTLRVLGDVQGAIREGEIVRRQAPEDAEVLYALGLAYLQQGDPLTARQLLEEYLRSGPEVEVSLEVRALLDAMGRHSSANQS